MGRVHARRWVDATDHQSDSLVVILGKSLRTEEFGYAPRGPPRSLNSLNRN